MEKLLIVDGHNLLFQMFYGMPARIINENGVSIGGTLGFVGALLKIIRMTQPTHAVVLFDSETGSGRAELDPEYKANRTDFFEMPEEETPFSQLPYIYAALDSIGMAHAEAAGCEADDIAASYACRYGGDSKVVISSFDSDFFQLISENVSVLRYRGSGTVIFTEETVRDKYGIEPCRYADFKAMTGDSADNIRGADKIGPKTAAELISQFGTLENIIENAGSIHKPSIRASVLANAQRLKINYSMIKLDSHADMPFAEEELAFTDGGMTTGEVLRKIGLK